MAHDYLKAVIKSTLVEEKISEPEMVVDSCCEDDLETPSESNHSMGIRSPGGPMRGRSVKEFEEQLGSLKKENFNLKLRIYFLEERMGSNFDLDKENVVKKNVELMVELESLKKELQEKHELLCQAVKAIELEEEERKRITSEKDDMLAACQQEIESLKTQLVEIRRETADFYPSQVPTNTNPENATTVIKELQEKIRTLEEELSEEKAAVQMVLDQKDSKALSLAKQLEDLQEELKTRDLMVSDLTSRVEDTKTKYVTLCKRYQEKNRLFEEQTVEINDLRKRQTSLGSDLEKERKRYDKLKNSSDNKISDLQSRLEMSLIPKPATPHGSPQKDPAHFPSIPSPISSPSASSSNSSSSHLLVSADVQELRKVIEQLKTERDSQHQKIVKLKAEQIKACKIIKSMIDSRNQTNDELTHLKERNERLEKELEGVVSQPCNKAGDNSRSASVTSSNLPDTENSMVEQSEELIERYKQLTDELEEKNRVLETAISEKDSHYKKIQEQYEDLVENLKLKENRIVDLEFELLSLNHETHTSCDNVEIETERNNLYIAKLQEKDLEIERLNKELMKRNFDLQTLVNNELWQKNREIEKLLKKQVVETKDQEIVKLQNELTAREVQLKIIKEKISELGIDIDLQSGDVSVENNLRSELEKSEKLRIEANEVCGVLNKRLEELAVFLDSLLKQKSVLGFLGNKENKRLRLLIDQSLDLSRSLNVSILMNSDQSLMQLTNITSLLNDTRDETCSTNLSIIPSNISLTYQSHLYKKDTEDGDNSQIIETLRQQILNLKYELQLRDVELNKINAGSGNYTEVSSEKDVEVPLNTTSTTLKYKSDGQSESEAWSEPDRTVSRARIGLVKDSLKSTKKSQSTDSTEDEDVTRDSRTPSKKVLNESRATILELHRQLCELDSKLQEKEIAYFEVLKVNKKLKEDLENSEGKIQECERVKMEAEDKVARLQQEKADLLQSFVEKNTDFEERIRELESEKQEALSVAREAEDMAELVKNEYKDAGNKLKMVQVEMNNMEKSLRSEYEKQLLEKVALLETASERRVEEIQNQVEGEISNLQNTIQRLHLDYAENYVKKSVVDEAIAEIERLKLVVEESEERIKELSLEERLARDKVFECEEKINGLRGDLDNATLQYSEAVLEKTKITNEKAALEQEINRTVLREVDLKKRIEELESEILVLKQNSLKQMSLIEQQKSRLEVRISELESSNAELHNRLIKIQAGFGDHVLSTSLPTPSNNFVNQIVSFRRQHSDNSGGYLSEEHFIGEDIRQGRTFSNRLLGNQNVDVERHEANSSPDLGIESDHGRFSSLETQMNNISRPLLQTLELTESMSNLLDVENNQVQSVNTCASDHCCQKTLQMATENSDLKRKLLRTRRALEETVTQLTLANQRKKQVEKNICSQIHKTSQVLRKAKANLDSGSETDLYKK